jgi:serine/threonine protein kinase
VYDIDTVLLDRYQVFGYREGGMGIVYFVTDLVTGREFAAKTSKAGGGEDLLKRFCDELELAIALGEHENVLTIRFLEIIDGRPFLFTDFIDGGEKGSTLGERIRNGEIDPPTAIRFAHQIAKGMEFLNNRGSIAHLDLKPGNLLVTQDDVVKITDFGLARRVDPFAFRPRSEASGSWPYMSPEQFNGEVVDTRSDVYAFGIIFYEMLTGKYPFAASFEGRPDEEIYSFFKEMHSNQDLGPQIYWHGLPELPGSRSLSQSALGDSRYSPENLGEIIGACIDRDIYNRYYVFRQIRQSLEFAFPSYLSQHYGADQQRGDFERGLDFQKLGNHSRALNHFNKALKDRPKDARIWCAAAESLAQVGLRENAVSFAQTALALDPQDPAACRLLDSLEGRSSLEELV